MSKDIFLNYKTLSKLAKNWGRTVEYDGDQGEKVEEAVRELLQKDAPNHLLLGATMRIAESNEAILEEMKNIKHAVTCHCRDSMIEYHRKRREYNLMVKAQSIKYIESLEEKHGPCPSPWPRRYLQSVLYYVINFIIEDNYHNYRFWKWENDSYREGNELNLAFKRQVRRNITAKWASKCKSAQELRKWLRRKRRINANREIQTKTS